MNNTLFVTICNGQTKLSKQGTRLVLVYTTLFNQVVKEFSTGAEFRYEPDGGFRRNNFIELDDVWVV
jgi:hypothetical protein